MTETGIMKYWNDGRGFGFIAPDQGGSNVFAHVSRGNGSPVQGVRVEYESAPGDRSPVTVWWRLLSNQASMSASGE